MLLDKDKSNVTSAVKLLANLLVTGYYLPLNELS